MRPRLMAVLMIAVSSVAPAEGVDRETINKIVDEGFNHSELPQTA